MATYVAANATSSAVQDAIDLASDGDTVEIPAGTETWTGSVSNDQALISTDKAIHIKGAGIGQTNLTNGLTGSRVHLIRIANHATLNSRISGISVLGLTDLLRGFRVSHTVAGGVGWRIHDCDFTGSGNCNAINVYGLGKGLIDNCQFTGGGSAEMIHNFGDGTVAFGAGTAQGWLVDISPGSDDAVYIEDCTFSNTITTGLYVGCSALQSYYGARTVLRHCQLNFCLIDQHGTAGAYGARWWEFYNNDFWVPSGGNQSAYFDIRGGSGVVFNITKSGFSNAGAGSFQFREEDTSAGYPELWQVGRGKGTGTNGQNSQELDPAYCWNNFKAAGPDGNRVQADRDVYDDTQRGSYTAYTYPHPLRGGSVQVSRGVSFAYFR